MSGFRSSTSSGVDGLTCTREWTLNMLTYVTIVEIIACTVTCAHRNLHSGAAHIGSHPSSPVEEHTEPLVRTNDTEYPSRLHPGWLCTCHSPSFCF